MLSDVPIKDWAANNAFANSGIALNQERPVPFPVAFLFTYSMRLVSGGGRHSGFSVSNTVMENRKVSFDSQVKPLKLQLPMIPR